MGETKKDEEKRGERELNRETKSLSNTTRHQDQCVGFSGVVANCVEEDRRQQQKDLFQGDKTVTILLFR